MKLIILSLTIVVLALVSGCNYTDARGRPFFSEKIEKPPTEFESYKLIDEISEFGNYTVEKFKTSPGSKTTITINKSTNNVIIKVTEYIDDSSRRYVYYKLNIHGVIIDKHEFTLSSLIKNHTGDEVMDSSIFLVNKELGYYTSWPLDGDKTKKLFITINQNLKWSTEQVESYYKEVVLKSARLEDIEAWEKVSKQENKRRLRKLYYINTTGKWYVLYGDALKSDYLVKPLQTQNTAILPEPEDTGRGFGQSNPPTSMKINYFEKQKFDTTEYCNYGCYTTDTWAGLGYFQVMIGESTFKFKTKGSLSRSDGKAFPMKESLLGDFYYYTNSNLKYSLFSNGNTLYLFKQK